MACVLQKTRTSPEQIIPKSTDAVTKEVATVEEKTAKSVMVVVNGDGDWGGNVDGVGGVGGGGTGVGTAIGVGGGGGDRDAKVEVAVFG